MKKKFVVIILLLGLLVFTVQKMMKFEESIRQDHIITHFVEDETKPLIEKLNDNEIEELVRSLNPKFRTGNTYFQERIPNTGIWQNIFLKGVNLGVAVPGKFPAEFSLSFEQYLDWLVKIGNMNSNVIRLYTILPPDFYKALAYYNLRHQNKPLYIMHGVWAKEPQSKDYFEEAYTREFQKEIKDVIDVVHGQADLKEEPGKAHGIYAADVSNYIIAYLLGREWEPKDVFYTIQQHNENHYNGTFISLPQGNPMEVWLAQMMDFAVRYETQTYRQQHPVSFVNWIPLDPMYHNTEYIESKKVREYDNDLLQIDFEKYSATNLFKAGIYAAYHVYPYYPDFIYLKSRYANSLNHKNKKDNYFGYLKDLKQHTQGMPLIIAEYGLPTSRGISHFTPSGYNQGGHSELQQARLSLELTEDILFTDCAGAIYFEWVDEWFKHNWLVMDFEKPFEHRKYWHNMENPEQNFGIISLESRTKTIDGDLQDWVQNQALFNDNSKYLYAFADPTYFYIAAKLPGFDFKKNNLYIAIDTYDKEKGDKKLPFRKELFDYGFEFLCSFHSPQQAKIQVDDPYSVFTDIYNDIVPVYASKPNENDIFIDELMLVNRGRKSLTGEKFDSIINNRSPLVFGQSNQPGMSNADWYWNGRKQAFELRLDWHLINVSDPYYKYVLDDKPNTRDIEVSQTDGIRFYVFITDKNNQIIQMIPHNEPAFYTWENGKQPVYTERPKPLYDTLKVFFDRVKPLEIAKKPRTHKQGFEIAAFLNNKAGAVSISFNDCGFSQYQYALPLLEKYGFNASFSILPKQMDHMPRMIDINEGGKYKLMGLVQTKDLMATGNEMAIQTSQAPEAPLFVEELNKWFDVIHLSSNKVVTAVPNLFIKQCPDQYRPIERHLYNGIPYYFINTKNTNSAIDSLMRINKASWIILNYYQLYQNSSELHNLNHEYVKAKYIHTDRFREQIRLARNTNYWIAPEGPVYKYLYEKQHSKLEINQIGNQIFLRIVNQLNPEFFNQALTVNYHTNAKLIKVSGALTNGYFSNKTGVISFNALPNQLLKIEIIEQ